MSLSKIFAIAFGVAVGVAGFARAADEWSSFTVRVQRSQGIRHAGDARQEPAMREAKIPSEASSFIARVVESQGIVTTGSEAPRATRITSEATSFMTRVQLSQGFVRYTEGASAGEPSAR